MFSNPLNTLSNAKKSLYISHKIGVKEDDYNNSIPIYDKPKFYGNVIYMPLTGNDLDGFMKEYGEMSDSIVRAFVDYRDTNKFHEFDIAYLYEANPENELVYGDNANYVIRAVKPQNTKTMILFEKIIKGDN